MRSKFVTCQSTEAGAALETEASGVHGRPVCSSCAPEDGRPELLLCRMSTARSLLGLSCLFDR